MKANSQVRRLVGMLRIFLISGTICLVVSLYLAWDAERFARTASAADGIVVSLKDERDVNTRPMFTPLIRFEDAAKKDWTVRYSWSSATPALRTGDHVRVLYHSEDPESARFDGPDGIDLLPRTLRVIGVSHLCIGLVMVIAYRSLHE